MTKSWRFMPGRVTLQLTLLGVMLFSSAVAEDSVLTFLGEGNAELSFRYRYEFVDQSGLPEKAHASTLRSRLVYQTAQDSQVALLIEVDNVSRLGALNFSDGNQTVSGHPVVADPAGTEVNQVHLVLKPSEALTVRLGRQRINLDDQRFVGGVGWRQNEQTYDSARVSARLTESVQLDYTYLWNVNRIFGPQGGNQMPDWSCNCHLLNLATKPWAKAQLAFFVYQLDIEDAVTLASTTIGARLSGEHEVSEGKNLSYLLSFARQTDSGNNPVRYNAPYFHFRTGVNAGRISANLGYEVLGGDTNANGAQFVTPLATLHAFNGWADKFLATPNAGLEDLYAQLAFSLAGAKTSISFHDFSAESGSADYGQEWDLSVTKKVSKQLSILGKLAFYQSDGFATDTNKAWVMLSFKP